jgi:hypothetical protein
MNINRIRSQLEKQGYIEILWHVDDVKAVRSDLTDDQCREVLQRCLDHMDAGIGINWEVIEIHAADLYPEPREEAGI